jgi:hypothetical protein
MVAANGLSYFLVIALFLASVIARMAATTDRHAVKIAAGIGLGTFLIYSTIRLLSGSHPSLAVGGAFLWAAEAFFVSFTIARASFKNSLGSYLVALLMAPVVGFITLTIFFFAFDLIAPSGVGDPSGPIGAVAFGFALAFINSILTLFMTSSVKSKRLHFSILGVGLLSFFVVLFLEVSGLW